MFSKIALSIALLATSTGLASAQDGWRKLFDGKTLNGWEPMWAKDWTVQNGSLFCDASARSWLATNEKFSNFHLRLQFKGAEKVNSGVFLRSEKEGQPHLTGYELQIWDYQPAGYNTGSLVGSLKADPVRIKANDWNQYDITADGDHFVIVLNGKTILDGHDSKHAAGVIGFQCQPDNPIAFRNIQIQSLTK